MCGERLALADHECISSREVHSTIHLCFRLLSSSRFIPPLNISKEDLLKGCMIFAEAVKEVVKEG